MDPRTAFPFELGEAQGLQRLRYYLGLEASDGASCRGAGEPPPIANYQDSRMLVRGLRFG